MIPSKALVGLSPMYNKILSMFPQQFTFCFAYGSGVFKQSGICSKSQNMIDLIFAVDNPAKWHRENIQCNPSHYSSLRYLGHHAVAHIQEQWVAHVYFNTLVPLENTEGSLIKYGVISHSDLLADLLDWNDLYLAGRLHKPVEVIQPSSDTQLRTALQLNLQSAVHAALLMLPDSFAESDLYRTITSLSYGGDFRMTFGEDKNKVSNIVAPQVDKFRILYTPVLKHLTNFVDFPTDKNNIDNCSQDISPVARLYHLNQLPKVPQKAIVKYWNKGPRNLRQDAEDVLRAVAYDPDCGQILQLCLAQIVWKSSVRQSLKGILTAGLFKSLRYSGKKILKMLKSKPQQQTA